MSRERSEIIEELLKSFVCRQCSQREARAKRHFVPGELGALSHMTGLEYAFLACKQCGLCDIYNLELLEEARRKPGLIEKLIGTTSRW